MAKSKSRKRIDALAEFKRGSTPPPPAPPPATSITLYDGRIRTRVWIALDVEHEKRFNAVEIVDKALDQGTLQASMHDYIDDELGGGEYDTVSALCGLDPESILPMDQEVEV